MTRDTLKVKIFHRPGEAVRDAVRHNLGLCTQMSYLLQRDINDKVRVPVDQQVNARLRRAVGGE